MVLYAAVKKSGAERVYSHIIVLCTHGWCHCHDDYDVIRTKGRCVSLSLIHFFVFSFIRVYRVGWSRDAICILWKTCNMRKSRRFIVPCKRCVFATLHIYARYLSLSYSHTRDRECENIIEEKISSFLMYSTALAITISQFDMKE
jgi:hypothetical protein